MSREDNLLQSVYKEAPHNLITRELENTREFSPLGNRNVLFVSGIHQGKR